MLYQPEEPLRPLMGQPGTGLWQLQTTDARGGQTGLLLDWQLRFTFMPTNPPTFRLTNGVAFTTNIVGEDIRYFVVDVPLEAERATNTLINLSGGPLSLLYSDSGLPDPMESDTVTLVSRMPAGRIFAGALDNNLPPLLPRGQRYYLAVRGAGGTSSNQFSLQTDFGVRITPLTHRVAIRATNSTPILQDYYSYQVPASNVLGVTFTVTAQTGDVDLYAIRAPKLPGVGQFDYASVTPDGTNETLVIHLDSQPVRLAPGLWYLAVTNTLGVPGVAYTITATATDLAANTGTAGASIAGSYNPGMKAGAEGPKPPTYTGFEAANVGGGFNGSAGYVGTPFQMNDMTEFTMMGWVRRGAVKSGRGGYFGQNDLLEFGDADGGANIELWVNARGGNIKAAYPFKDNDWGHFAVSGSATSTVLYANGKEIGRLSGPVTSYGTSSFNFNIGGGGIFNSAGDYFKGNIDEVAVFDKALSAADIQSIYFSANVAPTITQQPSIPSRTLYAGYSVTLTGAASGTPPLTYQWRKDGQNLSGKTSPTLSLTGVTAADAGSYELVVSSVYGSVSSTPVALVVAPADAVAPTLRYAAGLSSFNKVRVWFSEPLDPTSAQLAANYKIEGLTVTGAALVAPAGSIGDNIVELTTSKQDAGKTYTVTITGVKDQMVPATEVAANSTITFGSWQLASGALRFEHYDNLPTASDAAITAALDDPRVIAGTPTTLGTITGRFDTRTVFPDDSHENYMARISGFITPTETADYYFFVASDDASRVYLSPNETAPNPATDTPIVNEPGCCKGFLEPESGSPQTTAAPINLQAGKKYAILTLLKEGGGGDWLKVAWRKSTDTTASAALAPIDGKFLSTYVDPNAEVEFTKQPTNQEGALSTSAVNFLTQAFTSSDGGFTVTNTTPEPPGPWVYDPANGIWSADGSVDGCGGPYNSRLNTATYTVPESLAVTLSFSHRYSFEGDLWDGGQVLVSVNGKPFTAVPAENFTANGYAPGVIQGSGVLKGLRAFNADSPGYAAGEFITSSAILGTFTKGDKIVVQFLGGWDDCSKGSTPSWQIKEVKLAVSSPPTAVTFEGAAKVTRQGVATSFSYQWQRNDGSGFVDIANATGTSYRFFPTTPSDISASYRLVAGVPGKLVPSAEVKVTPPRPTLSLSRTGDAITVTFTGNLQSATSISGPFSNVTGATSPYTVPAPTGGNLFFRSLK